MTNQEIFDKVLTHLRKQGSASVGDKGLCFYRGPGGKMCAVGALMPDEVYRPGYENESVSQLPHPVLFACGIDPNDEVQMSLCIDLQEAHDNDLVEPAPDAWEDAMRDIAGNYDLKYTPLTRRMACL